MQINKPWVMYKSIQEIGEAIQMGLSESLQIPVGMGISEQSFLIVLQFPGNQAHVKFSLEDLKSDYKTVEHFVSFIVDCYNESMSEAEALGSQPASE